MESRRNSRLYILIEAMLNTIESIIRQTFLTNLNRWHSTFRLVLGVKQLSDNAIIVHRPRTDTFYTCICMWDMTSHVPNACIKISGLYKCVSCSVRYTVCMSPGVQESMQEWNIAIHEIDIEIRTLASLHSAHALNNKRRRCDEGIILLHHRLILPTDQIKNILIFYWCFYALQRWRP